MEPRDQQDAGLSKIDSGPKPLDLHINPTFERERTRDNHTLRVGFIVVAVFAVLAVLLIGIVHYLPTVKTESLQPVADVAGSNVGAQNSSLATPSPPSTPTSVVSEASTDASYAQAVTRCENDVANSSPNSAEADREELCKCWITANALKAQGQADVGGLCVEDFKKKVAAKGDALLATNDAQPTPQPADVSAVAAPAQSTSTAGNPSPKYADFPAARYMGITAPLQLLTPDDRAFRTRLRAAALQQINFAGEYVLTTWGCGTSCVTGAAINLRTGVVAHMPFTVCCWKGDGDNLTFKTDSRLLVAAGNINEGDVYGAHFFEFKDGTFNEIAAIPMQDPTQTPPAQVPTGR